MRKSFTILFLLFSICLALSGQEWIVPADRAGKLSPFAFTDATRKAGQQLYTTNCMSCHGTPLKGNVINLVPPPVDPASEKFQKNHDGELFFKISEGRGLMPAFRNILSSEQIWDIIAYLRSFNKSYSQSVAPVITSSAYPGAEIKLALSYNKGDTVIELNARAFRGDIAVPVTDAGVRLYVRRTFGMMPVDEEKITGKDGIALFRIPDFIPADTGGNLSVSARFTNEELFGAVTKDTLINTGNKLVPVSLVEKRAFWNTVWKAPLWLLITYFGALLLVWGVIMYVLLQLRDIFVIGGALRAGMKEDETETD